MLIASGVMLVHDIPGRIPFSNQLQKNPETRQTTKFLLFCFFFCLLACSVYNIHYISGMTNTNTQLLQEKKRLLDEIGHLGRVLHGTWLERYTTCSVPSCRCHTGKKHGPRYYVVINRNGKQLPKYIPKSRAEEARLGIMEYQRLIEIADRLTEINLALLKENKREQ